MKTKDKNNQTISREEVLSSIAKKTASGTIEWRKAMGKTCYSARLGKNYRAVIMPIKRSVAYFDEPEDSYVLALQKNHNKKPLIVIEGDYESDLRKDLHVLYKKVSGEKKKPFSGIKRFLNNSKK